MIIGEPLTLDGKEYIARFPIGALVLAEKKLKWHLVGLEKRIKDGDISLEDMTIITRYGLHHQDGSLVSDEEFTEIMNNIGMLEFGNCFAVIGKALGGNISETKSAETKN